jgi:3-polyprenyl-4-hydroxybenzoate decarboxylase
MGIAAQSHARAVGSAGVVPGPAAAPLTALLPAEVADPRGFDPRVRAHRLAWGGMLVVQVAGSAGREVVEGLARRAEYANVRLVVAVSEDVSLEDDVMLLWGIFTRFDCARDIVPAAVEVRGAWLTARGPLGIDATWKSGYPDPVASTPETIAKVDAGWER